MACLGAVVFNVAKEDLTETILSGYHEPQDTCKKNSQAEGRQVRRLEDGSKAGRRVDCRRQRGLGCRSQEPDHREPQLAGEDWLLFFSFY